MLTSQFPTLAHGNDENFYDTKMNVGVEDIPRQKTATELLTESSASYLDIKTSVQALINQELNLGGALRSGTSFDKKAAFLDALSRQKTSEVLTYANVQKMWEKMGSRDYDANLKKLSNSLAKSLGVLERGADLNDLQDGAYTTAAKNFLGQLLDGAMETSIALHQLDSSVVKSLLSKEPELATVPALFAYTSSYQRGLTGYALDFQYVDYVWKWQKQKKGWQETFKPIVEDHPKYVELISSLRSKNYHEGVELFVNALNGPSDGWPASNKLAIIKNNGETFKEFSAPATTQDVLAKAKDAN